MSEGADQARDEEESLKDAKHDHIDGRCGGVDFCSYCDAEEALQKLGLD